MSVASSLRHFATRRHVRPWALCAPIVVLIISIPLLRPLHTPDLSLISDDEQSRLATVQAIVEHHTLAIEGTDFRDTREKMVAHGDVGERFPVHVYSTQPPMLAVLLSGPYWVMHRMGLTLGGDPSFAVFWLTLLGITLPVALAATLLYRMSRIFELKRPLRATLALSAVVGSGLISYSTVLNAHAPAAVLVLAAATIFFHLITHEKPRLGVGWLAVAGLFTALAATIDPPAVVFLVLFVLVVSAFRWPIMTRGVGVLLYCMGAALPVGIHARLNRPITGDVRPGIFHPELALTRIRRRGDEPDRAQSRPRVTSSANASINSAIFSEDEDDEESQTPWRKFVRGLGRVFSAFAGWHGILSHFPVVLLGIAGVSLVMHRHWPSATKMLAGTTLGGALAVILIYAICRTTTRDAMFATRWFVVFLPLTLFWAGAWLRRSHHQSVWIMAGLLLAFSVMASLLGATGPIPRDGFDRYTVAGAWRNLVHPAPPPQALPWLADRGNQDMIPE